MEPKYSNWYATSQMQREAGAQEVLNALGFTALAGVVMLMLGSSLWNASQQTGVSEKDIQQALNNPVMIQQAERFVQETIPNESVQESDAQNSEEYTYPTSPSQQLIESLMTHEGMKQYQQHTGTYMDGKFYPYLDTKNNLTVGYGHKIKNGEDFQNGLTEDEALNLLQQDAQIAIDGASRILSGYNVPPHVHEIVTEMVFQMGEKGVRGFGDMLKALQNHDYETASKEMLDSKWNREDSPNRAKTLAEKMRLAGLLSGYTMFPTRKRRKII